MTRHLPATADVATPPELRVVHVRVEDPTYPRNARVREHLLAAGFRVDVLHRTERTAGGRGRRGALRRLLRDARAVLRLGRYDVYLVAEFSLAFAPLVAWVARRRGGLVVVDRFVGQYETDIDDHALARTRSVRALRCRVVDRLAERCADVLLIDTEVRAAALRARVPSRVTVLSLPVGAPAWATPGEPGPVDPATPLRVLFYGHDVPLHGVPVIVAALGLVSRPVRLTVLSFPSVHDRVRAQLRGEGIDADCRFVEPVPAEALAGVIAAHDVVLGVFGTSDKARTVIPNKVWQGLACGRLVVTGSGAALAEIRPLVPGQLVEVPPGDPAALAAALDGIGPAPADAASMTAHQRLEAYAAEAHARFADALHERRPRWRSVASYSGEVPARRCRDGRKPA